MIGYFSATNSRSYTGDRRKLMMIMVCWCLTVCDEDGCLESDAVGLYRDDHDHGWRGGRRWSVVERTGASRHLLWRWWSLSRGHVHSVSGSPGRCVRLGLLSRSSRLRRLYHRRRQHSGSVRQRGRQAADQVLPGKEAWREIFPWETSNGWSGQNAAVLRSSTPGTRVRFQASSARRSPREARQVLSWINK